MSEVGGASSKKGAKTNTNKQLNKHHKHHSVFSLRQNILQTSREQTSEN